MKQREDPAQDALRSFVDDLRSQLRGEGVGLLDRLERAGRERSSRLEAAQQRLAETLEEDHPRLVTLQRRRAVLGAIGAQLDEANARVACAPQRRPEEWAAQGRVVDEHGRPLPSLTVRVVDEDGQYVDVLGDTQTDDDGAFRLSYHQRVFGEAPPELLLEVRDRTGRVVVTADEPVCPQAGRTDVYQIVVPIEMLGKEAPRTRCTATTKKGERCRNPAVPGSERCAVHARQG